MSNRLVNENSPYLLQHAHNPVDWYPWGSDALRRARTEDKPIFLSIGYAACHWCHVMAHESFEDPETAVLLNNDFVCIKVDREERPELDSIYMQATMALNGSGGWPMSVFLTPDLFPFFAGTYFPPVRRYNLPSFREVLTSIARAWREERAEIERASRQVLQHLKQPAWGRGGNTITPEVLEAATDSLLDSYDWQGGGWGQAPKFPQPMTVEFLLCRAVSAAPPQQDRILKAVRHALDAMGRGGMYDVVGGGFARYSVDDTWLVPHFEKMLYDNAQLALAYLHAFLVTGGRRYRDVCEQTLDFLLREMAHPGGGFYSSLDADSEGQEGKYYIWTEAELRGALGPDFEFFQAAYGITERGNWEGKNLLQRAQDDASLAIRFPNLTVNAASDLDPVTVKLAECHARLLQVRETRARPATDDKILVFWNALALTAFAEAGRYLGRRDYLDAAVRNARFLLDHLYVDGRLLRSWREGQAKHNAYLEDYAALVLALLALYQSDPSLEWYAAALKLADEMVTHFADSAGGFFDTRDDHEPLPFRPKEVQDNATPSGNALATVALLKLSAYGDRPDWRGLAEAMIASLPEAAFRYPTAFAQWLGAVDFALGQTQEVALIGTLDDPRMKALVETLWKTYHPHLIAAISAYPPASGSPALLAGRTLLDGIPTAYVCQGFVCLRPVNIPDEMQAQLARGPK